MTRPVIDYGTRSTHDAVEWTCCKCGARNRPVRKLIFDIPTFTCQCGEEYLNHHDFDFCLADVTVNGKLLVQKVFKQKGPECMANACCQAMQIMHAVDCILKKQKQNPHVLKLKPKMMYDKYNKEYPLMQNGGAHFGISPNGAHKFIKMALRLKNEGIELKDKDHYKIGDICTIPRDDYEAICAELADGVPLLAVFFPGISFGGLEYCQMYVPPDLKDVKMCNTKPDPHSKHSGHMVVLLGPACIGGYRGFFFINSHGKTFCPRVLLKREPRAVGAGIGKMTSQALFWNPVKLCQFGESGSRCLKDEVEIGDAKYFSSKHNLDLLHM